MEFARPCACPQDYPSAPDNYAASLCIVRTQEKALSHADTLTQDLSIHCPRGYLVVPSNRILYALQKIMRTAAFISIVCLLLVVKLCFLVFQDYEPLS